MEKQGGITKIKIFIILAIMIAGFFCVQNVIAEELININTATLEELDTLPGIGASKAQAIIDYRELNGPFQAIEEITNVSGIGSATYENIKDLITVGYEEDPPPPQEEKDDPDEEYPPTNEEEPDEPDDLADEPDTPFSNDFKLGDLVVNEFVSDPADGEVEWIELYNNTAQIINLTDWSIEEGSGAKTNLQGEIDKFFIIEKPKGNLNNKGDIIILRDAFNNLIDQVVYGDWDDGNTTNNAPMVSDPNSIARKFDGQNSYNNKNDFAATILPTKGESNIILEESSFAEATEDRENYDYSDDIIISEVFPNPFGSDTEGEFIEIFNKGEQDINLLGWRLGDESKKRYEFKESKIIKSKDYLVVYRSESKIALNNTSDSVKLFEPLKDEPLQVQKYEKSVEGWSFNLKDITKVGQKNNYEWSETITPGEENIVKTINHPPEVSFDCPEIVQVGVPILFDSSDTIDEDEDELEFSWDFGDGFTNNLAIPEHTFMKVGAYTVKLIVSDGENEVEKEKIIKIVSSTLNTSPAAFLAGEGSKVVINEFLPNPEGSDVDGEWIEIKNQSKDIINLLGWKLDDMEGGSKPYKFIDDIWLAGGMYYLVDRSESGLALNNSVDSVRLYSDFNELMDEVEYESVVEGESYARGQNGKWFWTSVVTPGEKNIVSVASSPVYAESSAGTKVLGVSKKNLEPIVTTLEKIREFDSGDLVIVKGIVAVLPGVLGSQYFYIVAPAPDPLAATRTAGQASPAPDVTGEGNNIGIQVYSYKKDFPNLRIGDYIEVHGELSVVSGELRLKTKQKEDINILEHREEPAPKSASCDEINEEYVGSLVKVTGEIVERKSSIIYLDDGLDEILVYLKTTTGINPKSYNEGEIIEVTGIVGRTKSGIRIMPRSKSDIIKKDIESQNNDEGRILGETAESDAWAIEARDKKIELFKYLLVIAVAVIVLLGGLLTKASIKGKN